MSAGAKLIAAERERQIVEEGYTAQHDAGHAPSLVAAAVGYTVFQHVALQGGMSPEEAVDAGGSIVPPGWPWSSHFWKPTGDPIRDLTKAGALIAAALDSLIAESEVSS